MGSDFGEFWESVLASVHGVGQLWVHTSSVTKIYATEWLYEHGEAWDSIRRMGSGFGEFWESVLASVCMVWSDNGCVRLQLQKFMLQNGCTKVIGHPSPIC